MYINKDNFPYIASAVKLSFTDQEERIITSELNTMLEYVDTMKEIDTSNVNPLTHVLPQTNRFRDDEVIEHDSSSQLDFVISKTKLFEE